MEPRRALGIALGVGLLIAVTIAVLALLKTTTASADLAGAGTVATEESAETWAEAEEPTVETEAGSDEEADAEEDAEEDAEVEDPEVTMARLEEEARLHLAAVDMEMATSGIASVSSADSGASTVAEREGESLSVSLTTSFAPVRPGLRERVATRLAKLRAR